MLNITQKYRTTCRTRQEYFHEELTILEGVGAFRFEVDSQVERPIFPYDDLTIIPSENSTEDTVTPA